MGFKKTISVLKISIDYIIFLIENKSNVSHLSSKSKLIRNN